jgi:hypothetical protein
MPGSKQNQEKIKQSENQTMFNMLDDIQKKKYLDAPVDRRDHVLFEYFFLRHPATISEENQLRVQKDRAGILLVWKRLNYLIGEGFERRLALIVPSRVE